MSTTTPTSENRSQLRAALRLSAMPVLLGIFFILNGAIDHSEQFGVFTPVLSLLIAWLAFVCAAYLPSRIASGMFGSAYRLRTRTTCPICKASSPIICYRCTQCQHELGLPPASRATFVYSMLAYAVFLAALFGGPARWLQ